MKRVFRKKSLVETPLQGLSIDQLSWPGGFRQQVNTPVTMLGLALTVGASASFVSTPSMAFAAEGSAIVVIPAASDTFQTAAAIAPSSSNTATTAYYTVSEGDSLWQIAAQHEADISTLKAANGISQDEILRAGQVLRVPTGTSASPESTALKASSTLNAETVIGGVGGDIQSTDPGFSSVAVLSVEDLEQGWTSLETEAESLNAEELEMEGDQALSDEDLTAAAPVDDPESALNPASTVKLSTAATTSAAGSTALAPSTLPTVVETSTPIQASSSEAEVAWQDASVQLMAAQPTAPSATPEVASEALSSPSESAYPQSLALHEAPKPAVTAVSSPAPSRPLAASAPSSEANTALASEPTAPLAVETTPATLSRVANASTGTVTTTAPRTREQVIQDHLARIRENNGAAVDRQEINARIRQARQELERSRGVHTAAASAATPSSSAMLAREGATVTTPRASEPTLPPIASRSRAAVVANLTAPSTATNTLARTATPGQAWTVTDAATENVATASNEVAALPQTTPAASDVTSPQLPVIEGERLLAAAPLGAEAYRPFADMQTGQMVAPGMPMLPGSDNYLPEAPNRFNGYNWPARGTFTSGYGWRWGRMHHGIDIAGPVGTPIVAAASGVVVRSGWNSGGYGNLVDIRHADGSLTRYAHNSRLLVREGQQVNQGQQIAEMGSTGRSTGPHLHFEIHLPNAGTVNPMAYLPGR